MEQREVQPEHTPHVQQLAAEECPRAHIAVDRVLSCIVLHTSCASTGMKHGIKSHCWLKLNFKCNGVCFQECP